MDEPTERQPRSFQYRLIELFVAVTTFAVAFGMIGWWGFDGFVARLIAGMFVASGFVTVMEWHYVIKKDLGY